MNLKEPPPDSLSPEKAKYNKDLMTKTLRGEAPIIGTFIVRKEKPQSESGDEEGQEDRDEEEDIPKTVEKMNSVGVEVEDQE